MPSDSDWDLMEVSPEAMAGWEIVQSSTGLKGDRGQGLWRVATKMKESVISHHSLNKESESECSVMSNSLWPQVL